MINLHKKIAALCLVAAVGLLSGCSLFPKEESTLAPPLVKPKEPTYETAAVTKGSIKQTVTGSGAFVTAQEYPVYYMQDGTRIKQVLVQAGENVKKGQVLVTSETGNLESQIKIEQYQVQLRQLDLQQANAGNDAIATQKAKINLEIEQTQLGELQAQLAESKLVSPVDGQVISVGDNVKAGVTVGSYQTVVTIGDTNKLKISLSTTQSSVLSVGMKAQITLDSQVVTGTVATLPNQGSSSSSDSGTTGNDVTITLDQMPKGAALGGTAQVDVVVAQKDNTLIVPKNAVQKYISGYFVYVLDGKTKKEYDIKPGIQNETEVEVLSGLKEGQKVILN